MEEAIRRTVEKGFENIIDESIQKEKRENPNEWNNNPLFAISIVTSAIGLAKKEYKIMIKDNNIEFGIAKSEVDDFVEGLGSKMQNKYYY